MDGRGFQPLTERHGPAEQGALGDHRINIGPNHHAWPGHRREGRGTLKLGIVAATGAVIGIGPRMVEDIFALTVRLQPTDKTLTEADIEAVSAKIIEKVSKATGGTLRG